MDIAFEVLFDIMRASIHKYCDYDTNKTVASELIKEWGKKLNEAVVKHYSKEMQHEILFNILLTLVEIYPKDGLPREALNECIENSL